MIFILLKQLVPEQVGTCSGTRIWFTRYHPDCGAKSAAARRYCTRERIDLPATA